MHSFGWWYLYENFLLLTYDKKLWQKYIYIYLPSKRKYMFTQSCYMAARHGQWEWQILRSHLHLLWSTFNHSCLRFYRRDHKISHDRTFIRINTDNIPYHNRVSPSLIKTHKCLTLELTYILLHVKPYDGHRQDGPIKICTDKLSLTWIDELTFDFLSVLISVDLTYFMVYCLQNIR